MQQLLAGRRADWQTVAGGRGGEKEVARDRACNGMDGWQWDGMGWVGWDGTSGTGEESGKGPAVSGLVSCLTSEKMGCALSRLLAVLVGDCRHMNYLRLSLSLYLSLRLFTVTMR